MVHFWKHITNEKSTGPESPLFQKFKSISEHPGFSYAPSDLCKFDWKTAVDSLNFYKAYIVRKGIVREDRRKDRRELAEFVMTHLSPSDFKIRKTEAARHPRCLAEAIYYLKMQLLSSQLDFVLQSNVLKVEIELIIESVVCFYV